MNLLETPKGVVLDVYVKPYAKVFQITIENDGVVVLCREAPVKGKVNKELLKKFSQLFGKKVELVSGFTSRQKKFLIRKVNAKEVNRILVAVSGN